MRQSCYIHPTIIELYRWKEIYLDKENLCITTGVLVCFSLGEGGTFYDWGVQKVKLKNLYPPSVIYLLFSYLINMEGWIYHDWYIESEIIYVTPWELLRIIKVAKYWNQLNLSQYCIYATTFHICLTTSEFSTLDKSYKKKILKKQYICSSRMNQKKMCSWWRGDINLTGG